MGFESLKGAILQVKSPITADDVAFRDETLDDLTALSIVLQDTDAAEAYLQGKTIVSSLDQADDLYHANVVRKPWPGTDIPRASIPMPVVLEAIERILPSIYMPLFQKKTPFALEPKGNTTPAIARAKTHLLDWAIKHSGFKEQIRLCLKTALQYGFVVGNWGWKTEYKVVKRAIKQPDGTIKRTKDILEFTVPSFECLDLRRVLVDPAADTHDVRKSAKFIVKQIFVTADELDDLRGDSTYKNIPTREELKDILSARTEPTEDSMKGSKTNRFHEFQAEDPAKNTSVDPLKQPLEILEYTSADRVIAVLQRKIVIRNDENEFGRLNFVSSAFIDILGSAWGFGVSKLLRGEQVFQEALINRWIDNLSLALNPAFTQEGVAPTSQNIQISPGRVVTGVGKITPIQINAQTQEIMTALGSSDERASRRVSANSGSAMPSQALRTAEGVQSFTGDVVQRLQYFLELFVENVFVPVLEAFLEICDDKLEPKDIKNILSEKEAQTYQGDIRDLYYADLDVTVLAGTKLMAKAAAMQMVPQLITMVTSGPVQDSLTQQGKKFDYTEMVTEWCELMGFDVGSLVVDMTPEDMQRAQQLNPAVMKAQSDMAVENQKHQNDLENIEQKGMTQAGVAVVKHVLKGHADEVAASLEQQQPTGVVNG